MDHGYYRDRLSAYLDQELRPEERQAIADHLEQCTECREELARLGDLERLVQEHSGLDGEDYFERAAQKIEQRLGAATTEVTDISGAARRKSSGLWWKVTSVAASAAILVFIGLHRDDIFSTNDLALPSDIPSQKIQQKPAPVDTTADLHDLGAAEPLSTTADQEIRETPTEAVDEDRSVAVGEEVKQEVAVGIPAPVSAPEQDYEVPERVDRMMEAESSPPPAPSIKRKTSRANATTALKDKTPTGGEVNENYKQKIVDRFVSSEVAKSVAVESAAEESIIVDIEGGDFQPVRDLAYWVKRRDSLMEINAADSLTGSAKSAFGAERLYSLVPVPSTAESQKPVNREEADLLEAWFWISQLTKDSSETAAARTGLERVAADSTSTNAALAAEYLRQLRNK